MTARQIVRRIRELHDDRRPLNITAVKRHSPELMEAAYAVRPYWGWKQALADAGLRYGDVAFELLDTVPCLICGKEFGILTMHLTKAHSLTCEEYRDEFHGAAIVSEAIRAAKLRSHMTMPHWEKVWSREYVLDRMREWVLRGQDMNDAAMSRVDRSLRTQVWDRFGSWDEVVKIVGLDPEKVRLSAPAKHLTQDDVVRILRQRHAAGEPINEGHLRRHDMCLANAMRRRFGSVRKALRAAGIDPEEIMLQASVRFSKRKRANLEAAARRVAALKGRARYEAARKMHGRYEAVAYSVGYGSWRKVAQAVGVPASRLRDLRFPYPEALDEWYDDIYGNGPKPTAMQIHEVDPGLYIQLGRRHGSVARFLGSKGRARRKDSPRRARGAKVTSDEAKRRTGPDVRPGAAAPSTTMRRIVRKIRRLHCAHRPLNIAAVKRHWPELMEAVYAVRPYWGWKQALADAGIQYGDIELELADKVPCRICGKEFGLVATHLSSAHGLTSEEYLEKFPGAALVGEVSGTPRMVHHETMPHWERTWSREYVLDRMREWVLRGEDMSGSAMNRVDRALQSQIGKHFDSWDEALEIIGVTPDEVRVRRRGRRLGPGDVIQILRQRHAAGREFSVDALTADETSLYQAMRKHFGGAHDALRAAGIDPDDVGLRKRGAPISERKCANLEAAARRVAALKGKARYEAARKMHRQYKNVVAARWGESWSRLEQAIGVPAGRLLDLPFPYREAVDEWYDDLYGNGPTPTANQILKDGNGRLHDGIRRWHGSVVRYLELKSRGGREELPPRTPASGAMGRGSRRSVDLQAGSHCVSPNAESFRGSTRTAAPSETKRRILGKIRQLYDGRQPLNITAVKRHSPKLIAAVYAVRPYWGWKQALADAGIRYEDIEFELSQTVPCPICGERFGILGSHLFLAHGLKAKECRMKFPDAALCSDMMATGRIQPHATMPHWEKPWSREYVLDRMREWALRGQAMNFAVIGRVDRTLREQARLRFGSWGDALKVIGPMPKKARAGGPDSGRSR